MNSVNTATRGAPSSLEELKELLKNDIKVKVAGSSRFIMLRKWFWSRIIQA